MTKYLVNKHGLFKIVNNSNYNEVVAEIDLKKR